MKNLKALLAIPAIFFFNTSKAQTAADTSLVLKEAVVSASKEAIMAGTGTIVVPAGTIKGCLALLGEADVMKAIQLLPGVQAGNEGLSGIYVRGGGPDENLVLLDGVPVHSQGHLLGLLSPFQTEAVEEVTIHKGDFPARFGGRSSSVLEFRTVQPEADGRKRLCLGVGTLSDKIHFDGVSPGGNISYSVSGRGMHTLLMDGILRAFNIPANLYFHDFHARVTGRFDERNSLSFSSFSSKDKFYYKEGDEKSDFAWGTTMASVSWKRDWGRNLAWETVAAYSSYSTGMGYKAPGSRRESLRTGIGDFLAKADFRLTGSGIHGLRFGAEAILHRFRPEADDGMAGDLRGLEAALYAEDNIRPAAWLTLNTGIRLTVFSALGKTRPSPEPRLSISVGKDSKPTVKIGYSRVSQHIHQLSSPIAILPVDMIVPVTRKIGPEVSDQLSAGMSLTGANGLEVSIEAYWKRTSGVLEYKDGISFIENFSTWEDEVAAGISRSRGIELYARKSAGKTTGWLGYTLSESERRFPGSRISGGEWFPSRHDCRHSASAVINRTLGKGWDAGATWTYSTGGAFTIPEKDGSMPRRGNCRLPPSHRLDLGLTNHKSKHRGERIWSLGVYNAYNRKNPNLVFLVTGDGEDGPGPKTISFLPVLPSVGYTRVF